MPIPKLLASIRAKQEAAASLIPAGRPAGASLEPLPRAEAGAKLLQVFGGLARKPR